MPVEDEGTTDAEAAEAGGTTEAQPDWLLPRFKSVEEQARSYSEAERRMADVGAERNRLQEERDTLAEQLEEARSAPQQQQQQYSPDDLAYNPLKIRADQAWANGDTVEFLRIQAEISQAAAAAEYDRRAPQKQEEPQPDLTVIATLAEQQARAQNADYDTYQERAMTILGDNPHLLPDRTLQGVLAGTNAALNMARGEAYAKQQASDHAKQEQAEADRQRKLSAQGVPGGGTRPASPDAQKQVMDELLAAGQGKFRT